MNSLNVCRFLCQGEFILLPQIIWIPFYMSSYNKWIHYYMNSFNHPWLNQQLFLILLSNLNILFAQFVIDYLFMVLLFDAYTDHNAHASPAPCGGRCLSTDKEVMFGNKSESDMFQENQKHWFIFAWSSIQIFRGFFLVIKPEIRLVGLVRKLMEHGLWVYSMLNSLLMVVLFLHIKIIWIATVKRSKKRQCGFIILLSFSFSIPRTIWFQRSTLFMIIILSMFVTSTMTRNRNIQNSLKTCLDLSICGWVRGFSLVAYNEVTM